MTKKRLTIVITFLLSLVGSTLFLSSCSQSGSGEADMAAQQAQLPISLNEVMVALVNQAADPIWTASWRNPENDRDWRNLEYLGYQLEIAGSLLKIPGTGPFDKEWVARPKWGQFSDALNAAGVMAKDAAAQKDLAQLNAAGDAIVEVCEACHKEYKLVLPSGGLFGELSPTPETP